jgi:hypothetical protein
MEFVWTDREAAVREKARARLAENLPEDWKATAALSRR